MSGHNNRNPKKGQINIMIILMAGMTVLLLVMAVVIVALLLRKPSKEDVKTGTDSATRGTIVTKDNAEQLAAIGEEKAQDGYFDVSMSIEWHFKNGVTKDAKIANKTTNTRTVYFDLLTEQTEELVYSSPYIPVGESMKGFTLDKEMAPGKYDMIVRYYLVDDDNVEVSNVSVGITIYVE